MPYDQYELQSAPPWLQNPVGENWLTALGILKDGLVEGAIAAVKCRWSAVAPEDALPYIGRERSLDRLAAEPIAAYRARLQNAWTAWQYAGTKKGILDAAALLGLTGALIKENADWTVPPSLGYSAGQEWWRFWVIVDRPHPFSIAWAIGDGTLVSGPSAPTVPTILIGLRPFDVYASLVKIIRTWKPAHALLANMTVILSGKLIGYPAWTIADGSVVGASTVVTAI